MVSATSCSDTVSKACQNRSRPDPPCALSNRYRPPATVAPGTRLGPRTTGSPGREGFRVVGGSAMVHPLRACSVLTAPLHPHLRSEEHTSELQSRQYLV